MKLTNAIIKIFRFIYRYCRSTPAVLMGLVLILTWTMPAHADYTYRKRITIDHSRVSPSCSHLDNFPVLIEIKNDSKLKTVANGGHVVNANGHDIIFRDAGGSQLDHEVVDYDGSAGSFLAFVRLPQLSSLSDTIIYIHYGNPAISGSQENKAGVWSNNFTMVYHLDEAAGTSGSGSVTDSTANTSGTPSSGISFGQSGRIGDAVDFSSATGISLGTLGPDLLTEDTTISFWIRADDVDTPARQNPFGHSYGGWGAFTLETNGSINWYMGSSGANSSPYSAYGSPSGSVTKNSWIYIVAVRNSNGNAWSWYGNGSIQTSGTYNAEYPNIQDQTFTIGDGYTYPINGKMDEFRVANTARDACWIKTEYNNQSSPFTFYSVGNEEASAALYTINAVAGLGGTITPVGDVHVESGDDQLFSIEAAGGYEISDVVVDTISRGVQNSWTFPSVSADHTIAAYFTAVSGSGGDDEEVLNGCGNVDVGVDYASGFTEDTLTMINTHVDEGTGHVVLRTGFAAIDHEKIVIPFEQELYVNMLYTAGYGDIGYFILDDVLDEDGNYIGFNHVPIEKRHGFFRHTSDDTSNVGDGIFDEDYGLFGSPFPNYSEAAIAAYDDGTGLPFLVDWDGEVTPKDMRKSLGTFAAGTEIVIWMNSYKGTRIGSTYHPERGAYDNDDWPWDYTRLKQIYYNKHLWNMDWWTSCEPEPADGSPFDKIYRLGEPGIEGVCMVDGGWLQPGATDRLMTYFDLEMADSVYYSPVTPGEKFHHFIVGAPKNEPNLWILGVEQNNSEDNDHSDVDCNDMVFIIERKTGGMVELNADHAISSGSEDVSFTGVTLEVWDYMPCTDDNEINYELSIDNGVNWVPITGWDKIYRSNPTKEILFEIENSNWQPGSPDYTYRTIRLDFSGLGLTGHEIRWRASLISTNEACEPKILDLAVRATIMSDAEISRASPVVKANVLYSGSFEILASSSADDLRGHLRATRIYDPQNPDQTDTLDLWDAGAVLNNKTPSDRKIYIPQMTVTPVSNEQVGTGDGETTFFSGTLSLHPVLAETLTITDAHESFRDKHTDVLEGNLGGAGTIDRFSGEFTIEFKTPPNDGVPIMAHYQYYSTSSTLKDFNSTNVSAAMLDIDDTFVIGKGYTYDFDGDGSFEPGDDRRWLINWVRGYKDGASTKKDWLLGAIDHSVPAVQTPPSLPAWYYGTATTRAERESFWNFLEAQKSRQTLVYAGARDGMLHAFDGGEFSFEDNTATAGITEHRGYFSDYGTGEELWAFIPANLIPRLKNNVLQGNDHAFVDASPALADVYTDGAWRTVLLCAQGNGGDTVFALDVADPYNPKFMWEFADPDLFRSRSSPSIGKIGRILVDGQAVWVAFFVSGKTYNAALLPSIYIINVADGSVVKRVMLDADASGVGGVPSGQPSIVDSDGNGYIDRLYIGTDKGFLYKVNIPDDPDAVEFEISNCVINRDFTDDGEPASSVPVSQRYHPIYGSPVVIVDNGIDSDGAVTYDIKILFGTGDSPYFDEDIDMGNTRYHFFAYRDQAKKGVCDNSQVFLDWFYELPEGHRIFSSAFAAAGQVYFGTATSETEDPCDTPSTSGLSSLGDLYVVDIATGVKVTQIKVGNTTITPIVVDEHVYLKSQSAQVQSYGSGKYNNETIISGFPKVEVRSWHEIY